MGVMVNQIRPLGYTDEQIGRIGLASTLISCVVSISLGLITDRLKHKMKAIIITLLLVSTGSFIWLMLMCLPGSQANTPPKMFHHKLAFMFKLKVSHSIYSLSTAIILGTCAAGSCDPLFFEMTVLPSFSCTQFPRWSWPTLSTRAPWLASSP